MDLPLNTFKQRLKGGEPLIGLWVGLADAYAAELAATLGYDWLLLDGEHAPNDLRSLLGQLQAVAPYRSQPIVRPPVGDAVLIKQLLDLGAQTLLVQSVDTETDAEAAVAAVRYPPRGVRGVGSALARASRWNAVDGYLSRAEEFLSLTVQIESATAVDNAAAIAAVDGIDQVFVGPSDLAASMGLLGQQTHPEVTDAVARTF